MSKTENKKNTEKMDITVLILTSAKKLDLKECSEVILPTITGNIGILKGHTTLLTALEPGVLRLRQTDGLWTPIVLYGGGGAYIHDNFVKIMITTVDEVIEEDVDQLKKAVSQAELDLEQATTNKMRLDASGKVKLTIARMNAKIMMESNEKQRAILALKNN
jgi:F-type H+-transporting ATPase subunit epsilon